MLAVIKERSKAFLETIWDSWKGNANEKFGTVYGNVLYVSDLMSLKIEEELNDQIINLYCSVLQKRTDQCVQRVSSADCLILTSIFEGRKRVTWFKKDDIQQYDTVIGCINDRKCHWVAVVMDVQHHIVTIMDPLKISKKLRTYEKNFNYFTKSRDLGTWTICTAVGYPLQNDLSSCGVYCLKFLDRYLSKTDTSLELNVQAERFTIGSEIVQAVQTKGDIMTCFLCAQEPTNMRACSCCKRTFHKKCMTPGLCSLCSIFPPEKVRQSKRGKKEQQQKSIQILDESESNRQSKKEKKEEEQKSSENVDESESNRQSKKEKKEEEQKSSENVDESESNRQSKKEKKEEEQKSSENVDESESNRQSKKEKKEEEQKSSENVDESESNRQSKKEKKEEEQKSSENVDESGDVDYQVQSLNTLTEALVDKEATKKAVCRKMKGTSAQKKGDIEKTKEIVGHVIGELNKTNVNKAMHGKVFEAFWKTIETMLPDDSSKR